MKYIFSILAIMLLTSCTQIKEEVKIVKPVEPPEYRFVVVEPKDFEFKSYNSGNIIGINKLEVLYGMREKKLNLETMKTELHNRYVPASSCSYDMCPRYRIRVQYVSTWGVMLKDEFVTSVEPRWLPAELFDDSEFYKNIP